MKLQAWRRRRARGSSEEAATQDFLFVDGPVFGAPDAKGFLKKLKLLAATTDKAPRSKRVLSDLSPFIAVARLSVAPQAAWSEVLAREIDEGMAFDPWHALAAHGRWVA